MSNISSYCSEGHSKIPINTTRVYLSRDIQCGLQDKTLYSNLEFPVFRWEWSDHLYNQASYK